LPYFYQGFDHYQDQAHRDNNGIEIIDKAQVKLKVTHAHLHLSGVTSEKDTLNVSLNGTTFKEEIPKGEFNITLLIEQSEKNNPNQTIQLSKEGLNSRVFIKSITCN
jgi:hypothetical protein